MSERKALLDAEQVEDILTKAYKETAYRIASGIKTMPTVMNEAWEYLDEVAQGKMQHEELFSAISMYYIFLKASEKYKSEGQISRDNAFSTLICECGVTHGYEMWYRVMAYHYAQRAEEIEHRWSDYE